ncbi:hypothetical protein F4054_12285 [Candidatus Poribacteria bacterium]|nr:hypothetical protein [Candidatus Poribacteria bacterium]MYG05804.1 hypothetical protein [Candidatus Poribacteria bacterium]MYK23021.1 hypothetical protein [Candidatus Poribacteria bacterium]
MAQEWRSTQLEIDATEDLIEGCYENGWTDGLPVVPPTPERVERMLSGTDRDSDELIAAVPPKWGRATVEKVAINAVMAGCKPAYLPLILTAVEAMTSEQFNLHGVQVTTSHVGPMLIVNGPIRKPLEINDGFNLFGQGYRANATIGRTLRLICTNIGGALPGELDRAAFGHAGKYTCCIAEKEEASPWDAMHVERGFQADDSTITVFAAAGPQTVNDHGSNTAEGILNTISENIAAPGNSSGETLLVIGVEHAKTISEDGFSKADIRRYIADTTQRYSQEDLLLMVAGGPAGRWSIVVPGWGSPSSRAVTLTV